MVRACHTWSSAVRLYIVASWASINVSGALLGSSSCKGWGLSWTNFGRPFSASTQNYGADLVNALSHHQNSAVNQVVHNCVRSADTSK